jgi:hypothetical protein
VLRRFPIPPAAWPLTFLVAALSVAGCAGGSSSPSPASTGSSLTPASVTALIPNGTGSIAAAPLGGYQATLGVGSGATPGTTVTVTSSTTAPAGAAAPSSVRRAASIVGAVPFFYLTLTFSQTTPAAVFTGQTLVLSGFPAAANYSEEFDDATVAPATKLAAFPGTLSDTTLSFTSIFAGTPSFLAGHTYLLMFYYVPGPAPSPTAAASGTPVPLPSGVTPTAAPSIGPFSTSAPVAAATAATIAVPGAAGVTGTAQFAGFSTATTLTLTSYGGLSTGLATPTKTGTVFFTESISASPAVTIGNTNCAGSGCTQTIPLTITPTLDILNAAAGKTIFAAECNATGCPVSSSDVVTLTLNGANLVIGPTTFTDITGFSSAPVSIVFYYQ